LVALPGIEPGFED